MDLSSQIQKFNFNLFVRYSSLENPAFWLALRFLDHNSRIRFFWNMLFLQNVKTIDTPVLKQKRLYIWVDKIFAKILKISFCGDFLCPLSPSELLLKNQIWHFSYFRMPKFMEKIRKKLTIQRSCIADRWKDEQNQIYRTLQLGWLSNYFSHHVDITKFH